MNNGKINIIIEGIEELIKKDLDKHKIILERTQQEMFSYKQALSHEVRKKRYYISLIGKGKFNDKSLRNAIDKEININIRHMSDKVKLSEIKIEHEKMIVDKLQSDLDAHYLALTQVHKN